MSIEAIKHYEAALKEAFPSGATGDVFFHWNEARKAIEQTEQAKPVADRDAFERHWKKVRGEKKSDRELKRHPLQPQTYIQDSANRHWVTWQAATRKASTPPRQPWVGLTDEEIWKFWWSRPEVPDGEDDSMEAEFVAAVRRILTAHGIKGEA
jgi:hypothetical protein